MLDRRRFLLAAACAVPLFALPLMVTPASAQFGSIFGREDAPRPPGNVPMGHPSAPPMEPRSFPQYDPRQAPPEPPPPPLTRFPQGAPQGAPPSDYGVRTQPLPPPPGSQPAQPANTPPEAAPQGQPNTLPGLPPGQRQPRGTPQPSNTDPQPGDEVIVAPPPHKIANPTAVFAGLDKITGRIISFDVAIDETVQFGALRLTPRACYTRPPTETANTDGFVEVDEITLKGEVKR
ncbi:MAG: DUF2155 domain-containing protein, partial [Rhizobiales bacterium]|nr:DUF2155 domain-containing protein [Hyphomicrobiales bacterium]